MRRAILDTTRRFPRLAALSALLLAVACAGPQQARYGSPEEAVAALAAALETRDAASAAQLFGEGGVDMIRSGDAVADRQDAERVLAAIRERVDFEPAEDGTQVLVLGADGWPFPIPLEPDGDGWRFDVEAGVVEIEFRRIGRNELSTIATLRAFVEAQREYLAGGFAGDVPAYADRLLSSEGARDGLYWPAAEGEPESPLGPLVAAAAAEGYERADRRQEPYHGYLFRGLFAQGEHAPGGARNYRDEAGRLTGGFALVAWPARYGSSGIMTFLVNQQGIVFETDLGPGTAERVAQIVQYDPDEAWIPTVD